MDDTELNKPLLLSDVLKKAIEHYKAGFQFFISISLLYAILTELAGLLLSQMGMIEEELLFAKAFISILIGCWASIAIIKAAADLIQRKKFSSNKALSVARSKYANYLTVYLALLLIVGCGFLLLIFPGIYFMTIFLFVDILVILEHATFRHVFRRSAQLIRPFFWKVFSYLMIVVFISLTPEMIYKLGLSLYPSMASAMHKVFAVVIMPFLMIAQVELYLQIKRRLKTEDHLMEEHFEDLSENE